MLNKKVTGERMNKEIPSQELLVEYFPPLAKNTNHQYISTTNAIRYEHKKLNRSWNFPLCYSQKNM